MGNFLFKLSEYGSSFPDIILKKLIKAKRRGVKIKVILEMCNDPTSIEYIENKKAAKFLSSFGIPTYFDNPKVRSHFKVWIFDKRYVIIGSHNLTQSGLKYNNEVSVFIDSKELAEKLSNFLDFVIYKKANVKEKY